MELMACQHVLVYFMWTFAVVSAQDVEYYLKGQDIRLAPSIIGKPDGILWMHDGNEVVLFVGMEESVFSPYKNRIILDRASAELTIKNATYEDSGEYDLQVLINKRVPHFRYRIEVIDKVSKPNISCEMSGTKQATLVCSTESKHPRLLEFKWSSRGNEQTGPNLTITVENDDDEEVYRCDVSNPLTNETASFTAKDCFPGKQSDTPLAVIITLLTLFFTVAVVLGRVLYENCQASKHLGHNERRTEKFNSKQQDDSGCNKELMKDELRDSAVSLNTSSDSLHSAGLNASSELEDTSKSLEKPLAAT
ncbi:SLAM family member 9-like isoform X2 [Dunckerocampus dactyliophorus]|uniref:SLAM family member 9-like isoform X2 n=1 Tax=Dunckerocampus dactyliophorus TaxID=161453 RepID=UPI002405FD3F|nr:SLAM family member 9-like isoform X2 [Dunckerocampus dactyliophorus]